MEHAAAPVLLVVCGWLAIGTLCSRLDIGTFPFAGLSGHTPIDVLRRFLDWLGATSAFTFSMERWCGSHTILLNALGFLVSAFSVYSSWKVGRSKGWSSVFVSIEVPAFMLSLSLWLQSGAPGWLIPGATLIAWLLSAHGLGIIIDWRNLRHHNIPTDGGLFYDLFTWPITLFAALIYPLLVLVRLLFDGMPSGNV